MKIKLKDFLKTAVDSGYEVFSPENMAENVRNTLLKSKNNEIDADEAEDFTDLLKSMGKITCVDENEKEVTLYYSKISDEILKARTGRYADTSKNRRLKRVGQEYGAAAKGEKDSGGVEKKTTGGSAKLAKYSTDKLKSAKTRYEKQLQEATNDKSEGGAELRKKLNRRISRVTKELNLREPNAHRDSMTAAAESAGKKIREKFKDDSKGAAKKEESTKRSILEAKVGDIARMQDGVGLASFSDLMGKDLKIVDKNMVSFATGEQPYYQVEYEGMKGSAIEVPGRFLEKKSKDSGEDPGGSSEGKGSKLKTSKGGQNLGRTYEGNEYDEEGRAISENQKPTTQEEADHRQKKAEEDAARSKDLARSWKGADMTPREIKAYVTAQRDIHEKGSHHWNKWNQWALSLEKDKPSSGRQTKETSKKHPIDRIPTPGNHEGALNPGDILNGGLVVMGYIEDGGPRMMAVDPIYGSRMLFQLDKTKSAENFTNNMNNRGSVNEKGSTKEKKKTRSLPNFLTSEYEDASKEMDALAKEHKVELKMVGKKLKAFGKPSDISNFISEFDD